MTRFRWFAVGLCILCGAVDGLDLLLMSYALPHLPADFASNGQKGLLVSLAFVGYGIGAAVIAPMADRVGRKRVVVGSLVFATVVLAATGFAPNVEWMMAGRLLTGVAVGAMLPLVHVLGDEYATQNRRGLAVALVTLGLPIGTLIGGLVSLFVIGSFDGAWPALFWFGAIISGVVTLLVALAMPESPAFLASHSDPSRIGRIEAVARRLRLNDVDAAALATRVDTGDPAGEEKTGVLAPRYRVRSLLIWGGYTLGILGYYFVNSWTPQLISTATGSTETGALIATVISVGGILGGIGFALLTLRLLPTKLCWIALVTAAVAQIAFAMTLSGGVAYVAAVLLGMGMQAGLSAYMTSATRLYPTVIRARALGLMGGFSRVGSITAPLLVGAFLAVVTARTMYLASSVIVLVAGLAALALWAHTKRELTDGTESTRSEESSDDDRDAVVSA